MKIERKVFHRRDTEHTEMIYLFSLPLTPVKLAVAFNGAGTPAKKNAHALRARLDKCKELTRSVRSFPFLPSSAPWNGRSLFLRGQQKREKRFPLLAPLNAKLI
jgi:hypothetical protein